MAENGFVIGIVADLEDPLTLGRIRVKYPHLEHQLSPWARLVTPFAGKDRGMFFRPEVGDQVFVGFLHGDMNAPYIMGSLWNQDQLPPKGDGKKKENNWRFIKSRSGHVIKLDDTESKEKIEIVDKGQKHKIIIDCSEKNIQIICEEGDIEFKAPKGKILLEAKNIEMKSTHTTNLTAQGQIEIKAPQSPIQVDGQAVEINSKSTLKMESAAVMDIKAKGGPLNIKGGPIINLN